MTKCLTICATCAAADAAPQGAVLANAVADLLDTGWQVRMHDCLSMCDAPVAIALQETGKATYLFSGLTPADAADLAVLTRLYDDSAGGWIADARPAGRLRHCLTGRVPALP